MNQSKQTYLANLIRGLNRDELVIANEHVIRRLAMVTNMSENVFVSNGVQYIKVSDTPVVSDLVYTQKGHIVQVISDVHKEILMDAGAVTIKPLANTQFAKIFMEDRMSEPILINEPAPSPLAELVKIPSLQEIVMRQQAEDVSTNNQILIKELSGKVEKAQADNILLVKQISSFKANNETLSNEIKRHKAEIHTLKERLKII